MQQNNLVAKVNALCCECMLHASVQRERLVVAAEGLKRGVIECVVHADGLCMHENKYVHVLPQIT